MDANAEYLADGLTDSLINSLSQLPQVNVSGRGAVFRFKKDQSDPMAIARRLGVRAVLTGRIAQRGDALSISAELMDTRDGSHLWGAQYERRLSDLIFVQEEITERITTGLRLKLTEAAVEATGQTLHRECRGISALSQGSPIVPAINAGRLQQGARAF